MLHFHGLHDDDGLSGLDSGAVCHHDLDHLKDRGDSQDRTANVNVLSCLHHFGAGAGRGNSQTGQWM